MSITDLVIPNGKTHYARHRVKAPVIKAPDGSRLHIQVPQNVEQLRAAWDVLIGYTIRIAGNDESAAQDLDKFSNVKKYWSNPNLGYLIFTADNDAGKPQAMVTTQIFRLTDSELSDISDPHLAHGRAMGCIYQVGHTPEISRGDRNFSVATELYRGVAGLMPRLARINGDNWLGILTESRNEGPELRAIQKAGFRPVVPNEDYRPPAVQEVRDARNRYTRDLDLLGRDLPRSRALRRLAAEAYVRAAYCEGQDLRHTMRLIDSHFARAIMLSPFAALGYDMMQRWAPSLFQA
ncbi:hypothetical protein HYV81_05105 [Candidatus Woesearchaeota archaeon]|nr:hypothetical protein [Candidatus Woesearchaeota archaeon]